MNPGEPAAREAGCTCPDDQMQAQMRQALPKDTTDSETYLIEEGCPMHGKVTWQSGSTIH